LANFQLLSNTGTFQLDVQVFFVAAVHKVDGFTGVYHNAVVTSVLFIHVMYQLSLVKSETFVGTVGTAPQSLIAFHVVQSKTARCQFVLELGHTTSQLPPPHDIGFQLVPSYTLTTSFTVS
jgi:hypothetical protein